MTGPADEIYDHAVNGKTLLTGLAANSSGEIFEVEGFGAVGMSGSRLTPLRVSDSVAMPDGAELMYLPERHPLLYNPATGAMEVVAEDPYNPGDPIFAVAAFNSPGYALTHTSAYTETPAAQKLPLFSYGAVGWGNGGFRSAVVLVDSERRQDLRLMQMEDVVSGVDAMRKRLPGNRLRKHLENCALTYGCPAGKNFFLGRYEAPLPTARKCNARCLGCISLQQGGEIVSSQNRIAFTPSEKEIADVAVAHIERVDKSVVSFGQGCEGEPLLAAPVIEPAICLIRSRTSAGTINLNTNGSKPDTVEDFFRAGLDSIRVSMNSLSKAHYNAYFRPAGYCYEDVLQSIDIAGNHGKWVSINYLHIPGFSDTPRQYSALCRFLETHPVNMIQWRNLNYDPMRYCQAMAKAGDNGEPLGMRRLLSEVRRRFADLQFGYFNPPKEKWGIRS